ncbi:MAG: hypothetical protein A2283_08745 [Lentisphaerae bacterium RIFOXYA12_FULL_48_11]|nr:MAG: hypothetical protein A2283_08745 [Lentisphaerae bacterium RIFOXYA12_FULL_48_11]
MSLDVKKIPIFADFDEKEIGAISGMALKSIIQQGEFVFRENDPGDTLIILELGSIRLTKKIANGDEHEVVTLGSGSYMGEMSLFDQGRRSTSGQAMERCEIMVIPLNLLRSLLDQNATMAAKFYKRLASGIARRLKYLNEDFVALKKFLATRG